MSSRPGAGPCPQSLQCQSMGHLLRGGLGDLLQTYIRGPPHSTGLQILGVSLWSCVKSEVLQVS